MKKVLLVVVAVLFVSSLSVAQLSAGKLGVSTDIDIASNTGVGAIGAAYALSENMRLDAGLAFVSTSPSVGSSVTQFGIGASLKMYNPAMENVSYYYGGGFSFHTDGATTSTSTIAIGVLGGADYWFSSRFALGGHVNFGFVNQGASGAKTTTIGTMGVTTTMTWWIN